MKRFVLLLSLLLLPCLTASAQQKPATTRSFAPDIGVLGMGNAVVALPMRGGAFFFNPAHAAHAKRHITFVGVQLSASNSLPDQINFFRDELEPAIDEGIDNLDSERLNALYDQTLAIGQKATRLNVTALAPSAGFKFGPVGVGLGFFGNANVSYRFPDGGGGLPLVQFTGMADAMAVGSAGVDLSKFGVSGLTVGLTAKYTQRFATFKNKPLDAISDTEPFALLSANRVSADIGFLYKLPLVNKLPGTINVGLALYDVAGNDFNFSHEGDLQGTSDPVTLAQDIEVANTFFAVEPSFRLGVGYTLPKIPGGLLDETGFTLDYAGGGNLPTDQAFLAHISMGASVRIKVLSARAGLNQGYPTVGAGLHLAVFHLEYAYYGVENGRYPGQLPGWHHAAQIRFGL